VQEVVWDKVGMVRAGNYNSFYGKRNKNHKFGTGMKKKNTDCYQQLRE